MTEYNNKTGRRSLKPDVGNAEKQMWPTPSASEGKACTDPVRGTQNQMMLNQVVRVENPTGGQLNPDWVEWLMGWPLYWTSLAPLPSLGNWGQPGWWDAEPEGIPRVSTGVPDRVNRLKAIGNGWVPQVVGRILSIQPLITEEPE
jgi:DNA (cytosine-5)-methyltransferase 1